MVKQRRRRGGSGSPVILRSTWTWTADVAPADVQDEHVKAVYRVILPQCEHKASRKNCKWNPNCLVGLGEHTWSGEFDEDSFSSTDHPDSERRVQDSFVGLKNLGATCYVNTFLQLWFHNRPFRQALFLYQPGPQLGSATQEVFQANDVCGQLQLLFALLQEGCHQCLDPSPFVNALGLDTGLQQDAQEFCKLFLSLLESKLAHQPNEMVRNVISKEFSGIYAYITTCRQCGLRSSRPSRFFELDLNIQGHQQLSDSLQEFFKEESLEGENSYFCDHCQKKQSASRRIELNRLPQTLSLQLLRFVFDRQTGQKKKLTSCITFPDVLNMADYLSESYSKDRMQQDTKEDCIQSNSKGTDCQMHHADVPMQENTSMQQTKASLKRLTKAITKCMGEIETKQVQSEDMLYKLTAVLVHHGRSAYSGHYVAHISDEASGHWYKFNDEMIERMSEKQLQLGFDEDPDNKKPTTQRPRAVKGVHSSQNAYMLVYNRCRTPLPPHPQLPDWLMQLVKQDSSKFEEFSDQLATLRKKDVDAGIAKHEEVKLLYQILPVLNAGNDCEFVGTNWLRNWLEKGATTPPMDNSPFLCPHGGLRLSSVCKVKRISKRAASVLYTNYGGGPHLDEYSPCKTCVRDYCQLLRLKSNLVSDCRQILRLHCGQPSFGCWVGKASIEHWKEIATDLLAETEAAIVSAATQKVGDRSEEDGTEEDEKSEELPASAVVKRLKFNEDIICKHGQMTNQIGKRELVSSEIWNILRAYFPSCPEYAHDIQPCQQCQAEEVKQLVASEQSTTLLSSLQNCNRPDLHCWPLDTDMLYVVTCSFLDEWRKFVSHPERERQILSVENKSLLCAHQKLIIGLHSLPPSNTAKEFCLCNGQHTELPFQKEWEVLSSLFDVDCTISISRNKSNEEICYTMQPEECEECCRRRENFNQKQRKVLDYTQAMVYVRKIEGTQKVMEVVPELHQSSSECEEDKDDKPEEKDPDFCSANGVKRKRPVGQSENPSTIRRSSRHRRLRGDKSFLVSSSQSLKEFKIQIMNVFSVAPFDQNLFMEDRPLTDDSALLGSLGVVPGSVILLQADETVMDEEQVELCIPEEGFKGTGLLGN
uniref:ubiquitin carboxyl-terminal hydrolase 48 isoform X3 n=1 Tax=Myxine glutinosa TaxID=7769 RepID=UPI00358DF83B